MQILKDQNIAGITAVRARKIARAVSQFGMKSDEATDAGITDDEIAALIEGGWLKMSSKERDIVRLTANGAQLAAATMLPPLHRGTADRIFANLVRAATDYETDDGQLNPKCIRAIIGFGSYFSGADRPGDLDIIIVLGKRPPEYGPIDAQICERVEYGERFAPDSAKFVERLCWDEIEPIRYVKDGSNRIGNCGMEAFEEFFQAGADAWIIFDRDAMPSRSDLLENQLRGFQHHRFQKLTLAEWIRINPETSITALPELPPLASTAKAKPSGRMSP